LENRLTELRQMKRAAEKGRRGQIKGRQEAPERFRAPAASARDWKSKE